MSAVLPRNTSAKDARTARTARVCKETTTDQSHKEVNMSYLKGHEVDFTQEGWREFKCKKCGNTNSVLKAVFSEKYVPNCNDCRVPMELIKE